MRNTSTFMEPISSQVYEFPIFNLRVLRLYHGASLFTGLVFFLTGAIDSSEAWREQAGKSVR